MSPSGKWSDFLPSIHDLVSTLIRAVSLYIISTALWPMSFKNTCQICILQITAVPLKNDGPPGIPIYSFGTRRLGLIPVSSRHHRSQLSPPICQKYQENISFHLTESKMRPWLQHRPLSAGSRYRRNTLLPFLKDFRVSNS